MKRLAVATAALLLLAAASLGGWSALAGRAAAGGAEVFHSRGAGADAVFTYAPGPCVELESWVAAVNGTARTQPGAPHTWVALVVGVHVRDTCTGTSIDTFWGVNYGAHVEITNRTGSADGVVTVCSWVTGDCVDLDVSVDWQATGDPGVTGGHRHGPFCNAHRISSTRAAAVRATVASPWGENITPDSGLFSILYAWQEGEVCKP
jgi:hypothetical protein